MRCFPKYEYWHPNKKIVLKICKVSDDQKNYGSAWSGDGLGGCVDGDDNSGTH